ncbi:sterol desaturase [Bradyrhizobium sp. YR681]|uniref:sterol desaturase family protein n=1 Tax=Bradyrhizobium sp. YR681 TaxID=1144344 RepID=UPI000270DED0|nr:sterol desaturase family protein [Bradyrhizobium sp. YR681]EJN15679.1 sterol desaturase [Bradyrhizobium sp. YR681]
MPNPHAGLPRAFDLSRLGYFADFVLVPPAALLLLAGALWRGLPWPVLLAALAAGMFAWTLAEYWIHRSVFHGANRFAAMHDLHHALPKDMIGVASWGSLASFALICCGLAVVVGWDLASVLTAGLMLGYLFYCVIHVCMHHNGARGFGRYGALMLRLHRGHHRGGRGNYGVSSPLWDIVFRTYHPVN